MSNRGTIIVGLAVFCILVTFPFWYPLLAPGEDVPVELAHVVLVLPVELQAGEGGEDAAEVRLAQRGARDRVLGGGVEVLVEAAVEVEDPLDVRVGDERPGDVPHPREAFRTWP